MERDAMARYAFGFIFRAITAAALAWFAGCGGFGTGNATSPGSTPNLSVQTSYRIVGTVGTPFTATISDARSSWLVQGVVPLSIVIVNDKPPERVVVTKTIDDTSLLSIEIITGFTVKVLASTTDRFGVAVGGVNQGGGNGSLHSLAPPASPDVRFFVKGPNIGIFNALIEDQTQGEVLQARVPALILFDSPNGGTPGGRVDGIFTAVGFNGPFAIDLLVDGAVVRAAAGGTTASLKYP
jgi:hypothetical protein